MRQQRSVMLNKAYMSFMFMTAEVQDSCSMGGAACHLHACVRSALDQNVQPSWGVLHDDPACTC